MSTPREVPAPGKDPQDTLGSMDDAQYQNLPAAQAGPAPATPLQATPPAADPGVAQAVIGGRTAISEQAVAKVAAIAARSVAGVYALGSGSGRALGAVRDAVGASSATQGVHVEVGETEVAVDVTLVAVYGTPLTRIADNVRAAVYSAVESLVGLRVVEVNVEINDVQIPGAAEGRSEKPKPGSAPA